VNERTNTTVGKSEQPEEKSGFMSFNKLLLFEKRLNSSQIEESLVYNLIVKFLQSGSNIVEGEK